MRTYQACGALLVTVVAAFALPVLSACEEPLGGPPAADGGHLTGAAGTGLGTGLPCDVQAIIENRCITCHDGNSRPPKLLNFDDLVAMSTKDPSLSRAAVSVDLMKGNSMPPRPAAQPEPDEIASFEDWVKAGTPRNAEACTDPPPSSSPAPSGDAGATADAGGTCTSGKMWTMGNTGSPLMHPGAACNACHQQNGGPNLRFGGTVYPTQHEVNECNGAAPPPQLTVTVTDSRDRAFTATVNEAGNFLLQVGGGPPPRAPFRASVSNGTKARAMKGSVTSGDCNSCHTTAGANGAPGRILAP
jgi:hypothetical protein